MLPLLPLAAAAAARSQDAAPHRVSVALLLTLLEGLVLLAAAAGRVDDPVWRLPFFEPYETKIEPKIADLDNAPAGGFAGAITAALFLRRFAGETRYMHFDIYSWSSFNLPARPKGGCGQGIRALLEAMPELLPS